MAFLSNLIGKHFTARGAQGIQGTSNSTQGVQGIQGVQGTAGISNGTLLTNPQPGVYTLQSSDVGKVVSGVSTVGIPSDVFNPGENVVILNNDLNKTYLDIEGTSPVVSIYESGVGVALTLNKYINNKSFISLFCTRLNEFIVGGTLFDIIRATGGTIIDADGYRIHVFTGTGPFNVSFVPPSSSTVEYLVVAGGGGGGAGFVNRFEGCGGGGAGGFRTGTDFPVTVQDYTITVGGGGPSHTNGNPSIFSTITSTGGGRGGGATSPSPPFVDSASGQPGGSGGGACRFAAININGSGNTPPTSPPQGNNGGPVPASAPAGRVGGGGGGGAGAVGGTGLVGPSVPTTTGAAGGIGSPITWVPASYGTPGPAPGRYFAGGGGGGGGGLSGPGGSGGGGDGGRYVPPNTSTISGNPGSTNTGGGGGGAGWNSPDTGNYPGGSGGSGIVIIRYPIE